MWWRPLRGRILWERSQQNASVMRIPSGILEESWSGVTRVAGPGFRIAAAYAFAERNGLAAEASEIR
jgi:hypothetical protein